MLNLKHAEHDRFVATRVEAIGDGGISTGASPKQSGAQLAKSNCRVTLFTDGSRSA
jgi:hypothetical protein